MDDSSSEPQMVRPTVKPYDRTLSEAERLAKQRMTIVEATLKLFSENPPEEVGINDLSQAARMAKRTIYMHFASFKDVCNAAFEHVWQQFMSDFGDVAAAREPLITAIDLIANRVAEQPRRMKFAVDGISSLSAEVTVLRDRITAVVAPAWAAAHNMDCEAGNTLYPMTNEEAFGWLAMLRGMVSVASEKPLPEERSAFVYRFLAIYWRAHPYTPKNPPP